LSLTDFLKGLKIDTWSKATFAVSSAILGLALFTNTKWLSNRQTILLFGGVWLISLAEWKMFKTRTRFQDRGIAGLLTISWEQRIMDPVGIFLELVGLGLIALFILDLFAVFVIG
jgi:hypothetical protein